MKAPAEKASTSSNTHSSKKPFFNKSGEGSFFSKTQEVEKPFFTPSTIQPKLTIGQPNDKYEKEADAMADQVVGNSETKIQMNSEQPLLKSTSNPLIQRSEKSPALEDAVEVENEQEAALVQPLKKLETGGEKPLISKKQLDNNKHGGKALDAKTQSSMESQFGNEFGNVKIHDDSKSAKLASSIDARAFTYGRDIYFNSGEYKPGAKEGTRILAHELTHVVQQGGTAKLKSTEPKIQRLGGLGRRLRSGVTPNPWPAVGTDYEVSTDAGSKVTAWQAYEPWQDQLRYWCHGHSLGTYTQYDYSVYSGASLRQVIADEWRSIPPAQTQPGDIAVWTVGYSHSAKFVNPVITNGQLDPNASTLSSKNGSNALAPSTTLTSLAGTYGAAGIAVFRHV